MTREVHAICFTEKGFLLCSRLREKIQSLQICKCYNLESDKSKYRLEWCEAHFKQGNVLVFIGALGICVRTIAPYIKNKTTDPAVLCIDELGTFVISVLSGHIGGANKAAKAIADILHATPVITTATDINGKQAIDTWAIEHNYTIANPSAIKTVNAKILRDEPLSQADYDSLCLTPIKPTFEKPPVASTKPPVAAAAVGVGCRKGVEGEKIIEAVKKCLEENGIERKELFAIASIDIKKEEKGLIECALYFGVPFVTFSKDELNRVCGSVSKSDFVKNTVGVDCVCERAALCASKGILVSQKKSYGGVTVSVAKKKC
mgnify:FL=1